MEPTNSSQEELMSKRKIIKNLLVLCLAFFSLFTSFQSVANLQSTMNLEANVGTMSQSAIYVTIIVSALFAPKLVLSKLGVKWAIALSILAYCPYIALNMYPTMLALGISGVLLGAFASCLWTSQATYITVIACQYASHAEISEDVVISRFFGTFYTIFQQTQIWGNLISYLVLKPAVEVELELTKDTLATCGIYFCSEALSNITNPNLQPVSDQKRYTLIGIFTAFGLFASFFVVLLLDSLKETNSRGEDKEKEPWYDLALASVKQLVTLRQLLLVPLTIYTGFEQGFLISEFSQAYVGCSWGIHHVGLVFICYGVVSSSTAFVSGRLIQYVPRWVIMILGFSGHLGASMGMIFWAPNPRQSSILFILASIWGASDAIWQTQINAFYGNLFKDNKEAAFSIYRLCEAIGFGVQFAYSGYLCLVQKMIVVLSFLLIGISGYFTVEIMERIKRNKTLIL